MARDCGPGGAGAVPVEVREVTGFDLDALAAMKKAGASEGDLVLWRQQLPRHLVQLWRVQGEAEGWLLTRVDTLAEGTDELVLLAAAGVNARPVIRWARRLAADHGLASIRTHIKRPGLQRLYEAEGWHLAERVMRISAHG